MERYLQILVIALPALAIAMSGLLLIVFMCLRNWSKARPIVPVPHCSVNTQFDGPLQVWNNLSLVNVQAGKLCIMLKKV